MPALASLIIPLITSVGIPAASKLISLWHNQSPDVVGLSEWKSLLDQLATSPDDAIAAQAKKEGVTL